MYALRNEEPFLYLTFTSHSRIITFCFKFEVQKITMEENEIQVILEAPLTHIYRPGDTVIGNVTTNLAPNVDLRLNKVFSV